MSDLVLRWSGTDPSLAPDVVDETVRRGLDGCVRSGERVCVLIPDSTRTIDLTRLVPTVLDELGRRGCTVELLVALGTHQPMSEAAIGAMIGVPPQRWADRFAGVRIANHDWQGDGGLVRVGELPARLVEELSGGRLREPIPVDVNASVMAADRVLIVGPVFPHEVVGFSGGNKYLFPGVSGPEMIARTHWLGALIGSSRIIGVPGRTPVRAIIDAAAALLAPERSCVAVVTGPGGVIRGLAIGTPEQAWEHAAGWSAQVHVTYVDEPFDRALAVLPTMYPDLWTGGKGMYKLDPVIADGGTLTIYAPHVNEFSVTHGETLDRIGYHCLEYFRAQWDVFGHESLSVLAHSTHVRGDGHYDSVHGERCRIRVELATGISRERCEAAGLAWRDHRTIDPSTFGAGLPGRSIVVPHAGEQLYRLRGGSGGR